MTKKILLFCAYVATVFLANWLTATFGLVDAGFGLMVMAGTYSAGLALGLRDGLHEAAGARWALVGIGAGAVLSWFVSPALAVASAVAFGISEVLDLAVFSKLRKSGLRRAVLASNTVGGITDTAVFLLLAPAFIHASWDVFAGQVLVKVVWCTVGYLVFREVVRRAVPREPQLSTST